MSCPYAEWEGKKGKNFVAAAAGRAGTGNNNFGITKTTFNEITRYAFSYDVNIASDLQFRDRLGVSAGRLIFEKC